MRKLFAILTLAIVGCSDSLDRPIRFVVPDGFSGPFIIVSNANYPNVIEKHADRYELAVPSDGVIRTQNIDIFHRWHKATATFESGKPFPAYDSPESLLHAGESGTSDDKTFISWYFVGPYDEFKAFMYGDLYGKKQDQWLKERGIAY